MPRLWGAFRVQHRRTNVFSIERRHLCANVLSFVPPDKKRAAVSGQFRQYIIDAAFTNVFRYLFPLWQAHGITF
jgi:hypothetical protein